MEDQGLLSLHYVLQEVLISLRHQSEFRSSDWVQVASAIASFFAVIVALVMPRKTWKNAQIRDEENRKHQVAQDKLRHENQLKESTERSAVKVTLKVRNGIYESLRQLAPITNDTNRLAAKEYVKRLKATSPEKPLEDQVSRDQFEDTCVKIDNFSLWLDSYLASIELEVTDGLYNNIEVLRAYRSLYDALMKLRSEITSSLSNGREVDDHLYFNLFQNSINEFSSVIQKYAPPERGIK